MCWSFFSFDWPGSCRAEAHGWGLGWSEVVPKCRGSLAPRIVSGAGHLQHAALQHCSTICRYPHHHPLRHLLHSDPLHTGQLTPDIVSTTGGYILVLCPFIRIPKLPTFELRFLYIFFILPAGCAVHNSGCQRSEPPVATNYPKIGYNSYNGGRVEAK